MRVGDEKQFECRTTTLERLLVAQCAGQAVQVSLAEAFLGFGGPLQSDDLRALFQEPAVAQHDAGVSDDEAAVVVHSTVQRCAGLDRAIEVIDPVGQLDRFGDFLERPVGIRVGGGGGREQRRQAGGGKQHWERAVHGRLLWKNW